MIAAAHVQAAQSRLAQYYLARLRAIGADYERGSSHAYEALSRFDRDWPQVRQLQAWSTTWTRLDRQRATLCADFSVSNIALLRLRLPAGEYMEWLQQALRAARALERSDWECELLHQITVELVGTTEQLEASTQYATALLERARATRNRLGQGRAYMHLASANINRGVYDQAEAELQKSQTLLRSIPIGIDHARILNHLGRIAVFRGDYTKARDLHLEYIAIADAIHHLPIKGGGLFSLSGICLFMGENAAALRYAQESVQICQALGNPRTLVASYIALAHAEKELGQLESACGHYEEGLNAMQPMGVPSTVINAQYGWAEALFMLGQHEEAWRLYDQALALGKSSRLPFRICEVSADRVLLACAEPDQARALPALRDCLEQAQFLKTPRYDLMALGAAVVYATTFGLREQAARWAGCVLDRPEFIEKLGIFDRICHQLEGALGTDTYHSLLDTGKSLALEHALAEVSHALDDMESVSA